MNTSTDIIIGNGEYDVFGTGYASIERHIELVRNVYCMAYQACDGAEMNDISGSIYGYGVNALWYTTLSNVQGSIYCAARFSCYQAQINGIEGDIIGIGRRSMYKSKVSNVGGTIVAYGEGCLEETEIMNVTTVCKFD